MAFIEEVCWKHLFSQTLCDSFLFCHVFSDVVCGLSEGKVAIETKKERGKRKQEGHKGT